MVCCTIFRFLNYFRKIRSLFVIVFHFSRGNYRCIKMNIPTGSCFFAFKQANCITKIEKDGTYTDH